MKWVWIGLVVVSVGAILGAVLNTILSWLYDRDMEDKFIGKKHIVKREMYYIERTNKAFKDEYDAKKYLYEELATEDILQICRGDRHIAVEVLAYIARLDFTKEDLKKIADTITNMPRAED